MHECKYLRSAFLTTSRVYVGRWLLFLGVLSQWTNRHVGAVLSPRSQGCQFRAETFHGKRGRQHWGVGCLSSQRRKHHAFFIFNKTILIKMAANCHLWQGLGSGRGWEGESRLSVGLRSFPKIWRSCGAPQRLVLGGRTSTARFQVVASLWPHLGTHSSTPPR